MLFLVFLLSSCIGLNTGVVINNNGSGTIDLVYTVSDTLDSMGKQDGNTSQPPFAAGRKDFERTVSRIDGLSLKSYQSKKQDSNTIITVRLDFAGIDALVSYFDETSQKLTYAEKNGKKELVFMFNDSPMNVSANEQKLFSDALEGYSFEFSIKTRGAMEASFIDGNGGKLNTPPAGTGEIKNNSVSYRVPMGDLIFASGPVMLKIVF